ncbi:acido-empty-quinoprotein group A [Edaphobacter sp. 12200R-103]|nr:acido-empty-quinoprotein group A [Edaphobacter sp. 12200R-103]
MKRTSLFLTAALVAGLSFSSPAQMLTPDKLLGRLNDSWPTYSGDYTGQRYSQLDQISAANVKNLSLAWTSRITSGLPSAGGRMSFFGGPAPIPTIVAGEGDGSLNESGATSRSSRIVSSAIIWDGKIYVSTPDNAWAMDARDGNILWHFVWKTRGGTHTGNRGMALYKDTLFLETPDDYLVAISAKDGSEKWHKVIAPFNEQYFSTGAPILIGNHVLVGTGNDLDAPQALTSFDPDTGEVQWKWYATPQTKDDPALKTWANLRAARYGGGPMWIPGSYDPDTYLYIIGTGNPTPAYTSQSRGEGDNLYTCSLVALNVDTGKLVWYYQTSPHDTHDWDSTQTPVLVDGDFNGKQRKLVLQATRNGYFYVLDRTTGEHLLTSKFSPTANWATGLDEKGRPIRNPKKDFDIAGSLVSPVNAGATNWMPPSFNPQTGLFYVTSEDAYSMYYLTETDPRGAMGLGGKDELGVGLIGNYLTAMDYKTGKIAWRHKYPEAGGWGGTNVGHALLNTAGGLLFTGDPQGNLVAYDPANGNPLWHAHIGDVSGPVQTFLLDGKQYIVVGATDTLYAFRLN